MVREIILGNGNILICIDKDAQIRDFYFPYVGQENHVSGNKHRIGFFINNRFSWLSDSIWDKKLRYKADTLVSDIKAINNKEKRYFLINGSSENKHFNEYATGVADSEGKEGTYMDAQDGKLSNNP